jgi:integrase
MSARPELPDGLGFYYNGKSKPNIYLQLWHDGKKIFAGSTGARTIKEAKQFRAKKEAELIDDPKAKEAEKGEYTTGERTTSDRNSGFIKNHLGPFFGRLKPGEVSEYLEAYKKKRIKEGASPATINGEFRVVSAAMIRGWRSNKVRLGDLPKEYPFNHDGEKASARTGTITPEQIERITNQSARHLKPVFLTCIYTGIRPKELRWLKPEQVILEGDNPHILVIKHKTVGKTRKPKVLAVVDKLLLVLKEWRDYTKREHPNCEWFFHLDGERLGDWKTAWYAALRRADIDKGTVLFYDARRTHSTMMAHRGVTKDDRKSQMGHTTDPMSDLYDQSNSHVPRIREAFGSAPAANGWKAELKELKAMMDDGILNAEEFAAEKSRVLANR